MNADHDQADLIGHPCLRVHASWRQRTHVRETTDVGAIGETVELADEPAPSYQPLYQDGTAISCALASTHVSRRKYPPIPRNSDRRALISMVGSIRPDHAPTARCEPEGRQAPDDDPGTVQSSVVERGAAELPRDAASGENLRGNPGEYQHCDEDHKDRDEASQEPSTPRACKRPHGRRGPAFDLPTNEPDAQQETDLGAPSFRMSICDSYLFAAPTRSAAGRACTPTLFAMTRVFERRCPRPSIQPMQQADSRADGLLQWIWCALGAWRKDEE